MLLCVVALRIAAVERIRIMLLLNGQWRVVLVAPNRCLRTQNTRERKTWAQKIFWIIAENHKLKVRFGSREISRANWKKKLWARERTEDMQRIVLDVPILNMGRIYCVKIVEE